VKLLLGRKYSDRERIAILENQLKELKEDVKGIKEDQKIILERQEILAKNQVMMKEDFEGKKKSKENYFG
jgi:hypothetical protein